MQTQAQILPWVNANAACVLRRVSLRDYHCSCDPRILQSWNLKVCSGIREVFQRLKAFLVHQWYIFADMTSVFYYKTQSVYDFDLSFKAHWRYIADNRKRRLLKNNESKNRSRIDHTYKVGDLVLVNRDILQRKYLPKRDGPFTIKNIYSNGLVKVQKGAVAQKLSIRRLVPYALK